MSIKSIMRDFLQRNEFGSQIWYLLHLININMLRVYSDEAYFKRAYRRASGEELNFDNPKTFDEKQLWLKMYYRNPLCTKCSDKYLVREYVKERGLEHILNPLYSVYNSVDEIKWDELPDRFYIKANHMSGCNVRCNEKANFDFKKAKKALKRGMKHNYYYDSREWNYKDIDRKIIAEAIIENKNSEPLIDYKFLCFGGKCEYVFVEQDVANSDGSHNNKSPRNVYDRDLNLLNMKVTRDNYDASSFKKPDNFDLMLQYADKLSSPFPFCRVDLYNVDGKIIFGEITFFHSGGISNIQPKEWRYKLGDLISIEKLKADLRNNKKIQ